MHIVNDALKSKRRVSFLLFFFYKLSTDKVYSTYSTILYFVYIYRKANFYFITSRELRSKRNRIDVVYNLAKLPSSFDYLCIPVYPRVFSGNHPRADHRSSAARLNIRTVLDRFPIYRFSNVR